MATTIQGLAGDWSFQDRANAKRRAAEEDAVLVRRAQAADQMAFREIVDRYQTRVLGFIYRILRNRNEAEDIAQEVFASAFLSIGKFKYEGSLLSWLYRITVNECFEHLRRKKARPLVYESDLTEEAVGALERNSPALSGQAGFDVALADRDYAIDLLARISPEDRELLLLKEVEGYSVGELASMKGLNENTIKVRLFRARRKLIEVAGKRFHNPRKAAAAELRQTTI